MTNTAMHDTIAALNVILAQHGLAATLSSQELDMVFAERKAQDAKWGVQNHSDPIWLLVLTEEVGEVAQAILKAREENGDPADIRREVVQCAAVALAWLEAMRRNGPTPGRWER